MVHTLPSEMRKMFFTIPLQKILKKCFLGTESLYYMFSIFESSNTYKCAICHKKVKEYFHIVKRFLFNGETQMFNKS